MGLRRTAGAYVGAVAVGLALGCVWYAPALGLTSPWVLTQTGSSMPRGRWIWVPGMVPVVGSVVVEKAPKDFTLPWLMKRVVAAEGDRYCWRGDLGTHTVNGRPMPPPTAAALALGLRPWRGCRKLGSGEVVGYGDSPDSYDGRYRGIVRGDALWGVYRPLWLSSEEAATPPPARSAAGRSP